MDGKVVGSKALVGDRVEWISFSGEGGKVRALALFSWFVFRVKDYGRIMFSGGNRKKN